MGRCTKNPHKINKIDFYKKVYYNKIMRKISLLTEDFVVISIRYELYCIVDDCISLGVYDVVKNVLDKCWKISINIKIGKINHKGV